MPTINGTVYDSSGAGAAGRVVRVYRRDTGALLGETVTSNGEATPGDTDYPSVVLLARADGSDGATTFVDKSSYSRAITARGGAMTSSAVTVFGQPMMYFDGVNDYAECASGPDFSLPGDFTFEAWAYPLLDDATDRWIFANYSSSGTGGFAVGFNGGKPKVVKAGVTGVIVADTIAAPKNNLNYIRVVRSGTTVAMTVNGAASGSYTGAADFVPSGTPRVALGAFASAADGSTAVAGSFFHGYLAVRLTKGVVRAGGVPTAPFLESLDIPATPLGSYSVGTVYTGEVQRIVLDDAAGTLHNDLIDRVMLA